MAHKDFSVLLGYEDEMITDKHKGQTNFTTNKIGGKPDVPSNMKFESPTCPLCQLPRPLVVQIYAPLENSSYHRTLYVFACINPNCWNHGESWVCLRVQTVEQKDDASSVSTAFLNSAATDWCADADDWGDGNANISEENGNIVSNVERISDEEEESCSLEESIRAGFGSLTFGDRNANPDAETQGGGATGKLSSPAATAEIEGDEGEIVSIDTPTYPQNDIPSLLHEALPLPTELCRNSRTTTEKIEILQFVPYFVSVWEESFSHSGSMDHHVRELLQDYQHRNEGNVISEGVDARSASGTDASMDIAEKYEKSNPAHGDKMFHSFLTRIQQNPGQILRYNRGGSPLLMYPVQDIPRKCNNCQGEVVFEFQILSTLIPKLRLPVDGKEGARLEYGTVLIYTCLQSCWSSNTTVQQEAIIVQTEMF